MWLVRRRKTFDTVLEWIGPNKLSGYYDLDTKNKKEEEEFQIFLCAQLVRNIKSEKDKKFDEFPYH